MRHFIRIFCVFFLKKILINESLEYKELMLIPMAGVIVSRLSLYSFEELWRPEMRKHLRCEALLLQKVRNIPNVAFVLPKTMPALCIRL